MGFLDRLFGRDEPERQQPRRAANRGEQLTDEQALERYRYMLRTAPPEAIEQAHAEAFAQLTPEQRAMVLRELASDLPAHERAAVDANQDDPRALARMATRAELRQPGTMERALSGPAFTGVGMGGMGGFGGGMFGGSFLSTVAGVAVGSLVGNALYDSFAHGPDYAGGDTGSGDAGAGVEGGVDVGTDAYGDVQGSDLGGDLGADMGGDFGGDIGGDFGGADF